MDAKQAIWIKDPLAILAEGAERGIVVQDGKIVELVPRGGQPTVPAAPFEAGDHVVLPGLINTHHHFYQTLTRALPAALDRELFPWLQALYPVWARLTPESLDLGVTVAMSELLLSGCTTTSDHHYVFPAGLEGRRAAAGQRGAGRGHDPGRQRTRGGKAPPARRERDDADRAGAVLAVFSNDFADACDGRAC
jgi:cytosine/adenosine deaminase-related metal-dependent hydrolase